jgi:hypothetical protein
MSSQITTIELPIDIHGAVKNAFIFVLDAALASDWQSAPKIVGTPELCQALKRAVTLHAQLLERWISDPGIYAALQSVYKPTEPTIALGPYRASTAIQIIHEALHRLEVLVRPLPDSEWTPEQLGQFQADIACIGSPLRSAFGDGAVLMDLLAKAQREIAAVDPGAANRLGSVVRDKRRLSEGAFQMLVAYFRAGARSASTAKSAETVSRFMRVGKAKTQHLRAELNEEGLAAAKTGPSGGVYLTEPGLQAAAAAHRYLEERGE